MSNELNFIDVLYAHEETVSSKLNEVYDAFEQKEMITEKVNVIPGFDLRRAESFLDESTYKSSKARIAHLKKNETALRRIAAQKESIILPTTYAHQLIGENRLMYIYPAQDHVYVLPKSWKAKQLERKSRIAKFRPSPIRMVDLNEAYPNGIVRSQGKATKYTDRVKISLPNPPEKVLNEMISTIQMLPDGLDAELCVVADPKSLGTELMLAEQRPVPIARPRDLDPGLCIEMGEFVCLFPKTFYFLSKLERGFLDNARKIAEKWDAQAFVFPPSMN